MIAHWNNGSTALIDHIGRKSNRETQVLDKPLQNEEGKKINACINVLKMHKQKEKM